MEFLNYRDSIKVAEMDRCQVSTDSSFSKVNAYGYYMCINTWANIAYDLDPKASAILVDSIVANGLISTIKVCSQGADAIIQCLEDIPDLPLILVSNMSQGDALQLLRFPKRFSPLKADLVAASTEAKFVSVLNGVKMRSRLEPSMWLVTQLRDIVADVCRGWSDNDLAVDGFFSSGAVSNASKCLASKFAAWSKPYFLDVMYPTQLECEKWDPEYPTPDHYHRSQKLTCNSKTAKGVVVPKNYKTGRFIAEEESTRQWYLQAIRRRLERCIKENGYGANIPLENQGVNQARAYLGASESDFCTIDLSSASDSLSYSLFASIFPANIVNAVREYRSSTVCVGDRVYPAHMCATSGSAVCFVIESITFFSIATLASTMFGGSGEVFVYGDDIIVQEPYYETTCDLLTTLGFTVNTDKSFHNPSLYRESCGVEWYDGREMTSVYWPRKPITSDVTCVESLIHLHNATYKFWDAHVFLKSEIRKLVGEKFTTSSLAVVFDHEVTDLVDPLNTPIKTRAPYLGGLEYYNDSRLSVRTYPDKSGKRYPSPDMYYYVMYLLEGPMYDDPLSELLRVSSPRRRVDDCYSKTLTRLTLQRDI